MHQKNILESHKNYLRYLIIFFFFWMPRIQNSTFEGPEICSYLWKKIVYYRAKWEPRVYKQNPKMKNVNNERTRLELCMIIWRKLYTRYRTHVAVEAWKLVSRRELSEKIFNEIKMRKEEANLSAFSLSHSLRTLSVSFTTIIFKRTRKFKDFPTWISAKN